MKEMSDNWDKVYSEAFGGQWVPDEGVVRFTARYLQKRIGLNEYDVKRQVGLVLDAGCGNGRHVVFLAEQGFKASGVDISEEAINIGREWLKIRGLVAGLFPGNLFKIPYKDETFDVVLSFGVMDHMLFEEAKKAMKEIRRVSAKGAYLYVTLRSTRDSKFNGDLTIERNTLVLQEGYEEGLIQHFFSLDEIEELLEGYRIFDIECHEQLFPQVFTADKSFIQSSTGQKRFIDALSSIDLSLKYSRWHIAAERV